MPAHIPETASIDWCTPDWILGKVRNTFGGQIDLDPCSNPNATVYAKIMYELPFKNGLKEPWNYQNTYVNPPFGVTYNKVEYTDLNTYKVTCLIPKDYRALKEEDKAGFQRVTLKNWMDKCAAESEANSSNIIALIPAYVDTKAWQKCIFKTANAVCFPEGRLKFKIGDKAGPAPMACALVLWSSSNEVTERFKNEFKEKGFLISLK